MLKNNSMIAVEQSGKEGSSQNYCSVLEDEEINQVKKIMETCGIKQEIYESEQEGFTLKWINTLLPNSSFKVLITVDNNNHISIPSFFIKNNHKTILYSCIKLYEGKETPHGIIKFLPVNVPKLSTDKQLMMHTIQIIQLENVDEIWKLTLNEVKPMKYEKDMIKNYKIIYLPEESSKFLSEKCTNNQEVSKIINEAMPNFTEVSYEKKIFPSIICKDEIPIWNEENIKKQKVAEKIEEPIKKRMLLIRVLNMDRATGIQCPHMYDILSSLGQKEQMED